MRTLRDKLSHLSFVQACRLIGPQGRELIMQGSKFDIDPYDQVTLNDQHFRLSLGETIVKIGLSSDKRQRLELRCSVCNGACVHQGAALSLVLEEKLALGLSAPPPARTQKESLSEIEHDHHPARRSLPGHHGPIPGEYGRIGDKTIRAVFSHSPTHSPCPWQQTRSGRPSGVCNTISDRGIGRTTRKN